MWDLEELESFAFFRLPGESEIKYIISENEFVKTYSEICIPENEQGFIIAPFNITNECPFVFIPGEEKQAPSPLPQGGAWRSIVLHPPLGRGLGGAFSIEELGQDDYKKRFSIFFKELRNKKFEKLVLSRYSELYSNENFSVFDAFLKTCQTYEHSYVFLYYTPYTGMWLGSTPEIILSGKNNNWHTTALAGTQLLENENLPENWDSKNCEEQNFVSEHIRRQLKNMNITSIEKAPYSIKAGNLAHLKSDFYFSLPDGISLTRLLQNLHPTPAVCGLPKDKAFNFILENEGYDRRYYSGFLGQINPNGNTDLYVNLRCVEIKKDKLRFYAGGGILPSSELKQEWQETENKMQIMKSIISPIPFSDFPKKGKKKVKNI
jgi:isochorismate synthase